MKQVRAKIIANREAAPGFYHMRVESGYLAKSSRPGQFIEVRVSDSAEPLLRRPLGVHRITKNGIEMLYQVVGKGTGILSRKRAGEELDILGPLGNGFDIDRKRPAIIVAGGIGAAPLVALAEELGNARVIVGSKTKSHIVCERDLKAMGCVIDIATEDGSKGHEGLATDLLKVTLMDMKDASRAIIYSCGPMGMLKAVAAIAKDYDTKCQVSLEEHMACGVGVCLGCPVKLRTGEYKMVCKDGPVFNAEEIAW